MTELVWALGLMSGTSRDGIDAALIRSDGVSQVETGPFLSVSYSTAFRERLAAAVRTYAEAGPEGPPPGAVAEVEAELTRLHAEAVRRLLDMHGLRPADIRVIGFHGHTLHHDPLRRRSVQIGDGALLAELTGIDVVNDLRSADIRAGGQGAPLAPLYHQARSAELEKPLAVLNLGGVGNVTWLGPDGSVIAFDTGPGNALLDDLALERTSRSYDAGGALAAAGTVDRDVLARLLDDRFFDQPPPKSLDRDAFESGAVAGLATEDAAATLAAFTAETVRRALEHLPQAPRRWLVGGGGRHNPVLMQHLAALLGVAVDPVETVGWNGDAVEAEAFAYLALRSLAGLPLSLPLTTGVPEPTTGGQLHRAPAHTA